MAKKQNLISIKALSIGLLVFVIVKLSMLTLSFVYFPWVFENMGSIPVGTMSEALAKNPFIIIYNVFYLSVGAALPGYITAYIANNNYILHGVILAVAARCISILPMDGQINFTFSHLVWIVLNIAVTVIAAWGRGFQVKRGQGTIESS